MGQHGNRRGTLCRGIRDAALQTAERQEPVRDAAGAAASLPGQGLRGCQKLSGAQRLSSLANCQRASPGGHLTPRKGAWAGTRAFGETSGPKSKARLSFWGGLVQARVQECSRLGHGAAWSGAAQLPCGVVGHACPLAPSLPLAGAPARADSCFFLPDLD